MALLSVAVYFAAILLLNVLFFVVPMYPLVLFVPSFCLVPSFLVIG